MPASCESFLETKTGFAITRDGHRKDYADDNVLGMRVCTTRQLDADGETSLAKSLFFRVSDDEWASVEAERDGDAHEDCLRSLEQRVLDNLVTRAWETLTHGGDVTGDGWSLNLIELVVELDDRSAACNLQQVSGVTWQRDQLCIWHEDQRAEPMVTLPREAENAVVLHRLLSELVDNVEPESEGAGEIGLGAVLAEFNTDHRPTVPWHTLAIFSAILIVSVALTLTLYQTGLCLLLVMVVLVTAAPLAKGYRETLTHFERGLVWSCGGEERVLLMEQLSKLTIMPQSTDVTPSGRPAAVYSFESRYAEQLPIQMTLTCDFEKAEALERQVRASIANRCDQTIAQPESSLLLGESATR